MYLFISTADESTLTIGLLDAKGWTARKAIAAYRTQGEKLLPAITKLLSAQRLKLEKLQGIVAVSGPGPFTALRIGVVTANTLGYAIQIPIAGIAADAALDQLPKQLSKLFRRKTFQQIKPVYGAEPNISKRKA